MTLIDKIRELDKDSCWKMTVKDSTVIMMEMRQALISVDDVLKGVAKDLSADLKDGIRDDGKRLLLLEIRKAMEGEGNANR